MGELFAILAIAEASRSATWGALNPQLDSIRPLVTLSAPSDKELVFVNPKLRADRGASHGVFTGGRKREAQAPSSPASR